jgi:hypothetical protein
VGDVGEEVAALGLVASRRIVMALKELTRRPTSPSARVRTRTA